MYIIFQDELEKLARGELKVEDLTIPEKQALITWSGEDIKVMLKREGLKIDLEEAVGIVSKALENCDCAMCVSCAFDCVKDKIKEEV